MLRVGIFDSGLGGLTVVKSIQTVLKNAQLFYIADTLNAPYGEKSPEQILSYSVNITQYLIETYHIDALIIACNTATSYAIAYLRQIYPSLIIIGSEPALKPAIVHTKTGKIGVLATPATLEGDKYQQLAQRLSSTKEVMIYEQACGGLVEKIENGEIEHPTTRELLEKWLKPMREANVDTIVLGCTHYPLVGFLIQEVMQNSVVLMDTGEAIALHLLRLSREHKGHQNEGKLEIYLHNTAQIQWDIIDKILSTYTNNGLVQIREKSPLLS